MNEIKPDDLVVVVVGNWNTSIFQPKWIYENLLDKTSQEQIEIKSIDVLLNPTNKEFGYKIKDVSFLPKPTVLEISLVKDKLTKENIELATILLNKTLIKLPHTPIRAAGINFNYTIDINEKFDFIKWVLKSMSKSYDDLSTIEIKVRKNIPDGSLNVVVSKIKDKLKLDFNFHYNQIIEFSTELIYKNLEISQQYFHE